MDSSSIDVTQFCFILFYFILPKDLKGHNEINVVNGFVPSAERDIK